MAEPVEPDPAGELEALLYEQGGAMHRLARSLATDANAADDLVQDSALAALRKPAGEIERPGAWFAGTLKRIAARRWRDRERRTRRERENARPEALPSSAELLAQREVLADVMQAIRELDEIYARPLLLLYFHDMSAEEVARALGVPAATVRTRHRRALEKLRQKLDRNHGARESWCALLLALPRGGARSASSASSASALTWIATGVGGAALLVLAWLWWPERAATEPAAASATGAVAAVAADELAAPAARAPLRERALAAADAPPTAATPTADATRVSGRVRDPLGAGVPFAQIRRGDRNDELRARPRAICDATGAFSFALTPDEQIEFRAWKSGWQPSHVLCVARSEALAQRIEFVLPGPAEIVEGSVRDARGKPVEGAWVRIGPEFGAALDPSDPYGSRASSGPLARTDAAGEFRLDGVRDGPGRIVASHAAFGYAERAIEVPPGVLARFDLELAPFALVRGRARSDDGAPLAGATVRFEPCAPKLERDATTAADGAFELACPPLAGLELTLVHPVGERTRRFDLAPDARVEWDVVLPAAVVGAEPSGAVCTSLSVGIVDDAGELIRARVLCMSAGVDRRAGPSTHRVHVLRGIPGSYRWELSDVAPGHYSVWASAPGLGLFLAGEVDVAVGARNAFEFPAPRAGALQLSVAAPAARANERWWYVIDPRLYGPDLARGRNAGPAPREIGLAAGVHVVRVESERGARSEREFEIRAGAATVLELELP